MELEGLLNWRFRPLDRHRGAGRVPRYNPLCSSATQLALLRRERSGNVARQVSSQLPQSTAVEPSSPKNRCVSSRGTICGSRSDNSFRGIVRENAQEINLLELHSLPRSAAAILGFRVPLRFNPPLRRCAWEGGCHYLAGLGGVSVRGWWRRSFVLLRLRYIWG